MSQCLHWQALLAQKNQDIANLMAKICGLEQRLDAANRRAATDSQRVQELSQVLEQYDESLARLSSHKPQRDQLFQQKMAEITKQKEVLQGKFQNLECHFDELTSTYRDCKAMLNQQNMKLNQLNEAMLKQGDDLLARNAVYKHLTDKAEDERRSVELEMAALRHAHNLRVALATIEVRRIECQVRDVRQTLEEKTKENKELADMCDRLIALTGSGTLR